MVLSGVKFVFIGEYHHTIDDKGRLTIPSKIREELGGAFIVTRGLDNCLAIYKQDDWNNIINKYKELPNTKDARNFMRFFLSGATITELDKQGRVNISIPLVSYAKLLKECIIIGVNDHLEVWSEELWNNFISDNEESLSDIAENLFSVDLK